MTSRSAALLLLAVPLPCLAAQAPADAKLVTGQAMPYDDFGERVSLSGNRLLIGDPGNENLGIGAGAAYVFERAPSGEWTEEAVLYAPGGLPVITFGADVAIDGDLAVVSAPTTNHQGDGLGTVYVFERAPSGWSLLSEIPSPVDVTSRGFGASVDIEGDTIVVGYVYSLSTFFDEGAVYVFERAAPGSSTWTSTAKLEPNDSVGPNAMFGVSVDLHQDSLFVGASGAWLGEAPTGAVYVFERIPAGWWQKAKLTGSDSGYLDGFGYSVAVRGGTALIGAGSHDTTFLDDGAVYVFDLVGNLWVETAKLLSPDPTYRAFFGSSVALGEGRALIGSPHSDLEGILAGTAHLFQRDASGWTSTARFAADHFGGALFGQSVAYSGDLAVVGAPHDQGAATYAGAVYVVPVTPELLEGDVESISLAAGGRQVLTLDAGTEHAGSLHLVLGSASGTQPGTPIGGVLLPLNTDAYTLALLTAPGSPPLAGSLGFLDAFGRAKASFLLAPGTDPGLAGLAVHHAYVLLDAGQGAPTLTLASNAVPISLEP